MKIAIITPVFQGPLCGLEKCLASVMAQTTPATHFLVVSGDVRLQTADLSNVELIQVPHIYDMADISAARSVGSVWAIAHGFDAIAYLDPDFWIEPNHLQLFIELQRKTGAAVCSCAGKHFGFDGMPSDEHAGSKDDRLIDVNALFLTREAVVATLRLDPPLARLNRKALLQAIGQAGLIWAHQPIPTICRSAAAKTPDAPDTQDAVPKCDCEANLAAVPNGPRDIEKIVANKEPIEAMPISESRGARVSLCMIVKKEDESSLAACLTPIAKLFSEIILVVDSSDSDHAPNLASAFGAKVIPFQWTESFAAARNESIEHASGDWIFSLDADECIDEENRRRLSSLLSRLSDGNDAFFVSVWSAPDDVLCCPTVVDCVRLFRRHPAHRWTYRVHEQILPALEKGGARFIWSDVVVDHFGYASAEVRARKCARNLRLLRMEVKDHPDDAYVLFNLANTLFDEGNTDGAMAFLSRSIAAAPRGGAYLPKAHVLVARAWQVLGRPDEALRSCQAAKSQFPDDLELWFEEGNLLLARGDLTEARRSFKTLLKMKHKRTFVGVNPDLMFHARHNLAVTFRALGIVREAEYHWLRVLHEAPDFGPAWLGVTELYLSQKRWRDIDHLLKLLESSKHAERIVPGLRARLALRKSNSAPSRQILEDAIRRFPNVLWLRLLLSDILAQVANDHSSAAHHLREILLRDPNNAIARQKLYALRMDA